ncbi:MAG TPA: hypothetical protein VM307_04490 [Egibacteraceae bacterium]|nr:hypothetical protein [Egibacteraceae bacterium]
MTPTFSLTPEQVDVAYHALRYYSSELLDAFVSDDDSPMLDEAAAAQQLADRLQLWLVANHQSLMRDTG